MMKVTVVIFERASKKSRCLSVYVSFLCVQIIKKKTFIRSAKGQTLLTNYPNHRISFRHIVLLILFSILCTDSIYSED